MPKPSDRSRQSDKYLSLRAHPRSRLGRTLTYIQSLDIGSAGIASQTLEARFLPFYIDKSDPAFLAIALQCAAECEAWARAIREYASIPSKKAISSSYVPLALSGSSIPEPVNDHSHNGSISSLCEENSDRPLSAEEQRVKQGEDLIKSMGLL